MLRQGLRSVELFRIGSTKGTLIDSLCWTQLRSARTFSRFSLLLDSDIFQSLDVTLVLMLFLIVRRHIMLMCHKVTTKNLIDSAPLFRKNQSRHIKVCSDFSIICYVCDIVRAYNP